MNVFNRRDLSICINNLRFSYYIRGSKSIWLIVQEEVVLYNIDMLAEVIICIFPTFILVWHHLSYDCSRWQRDPAYSEFLIKCPIFVKFLNILGHRMLNKLTFCKLLKVKNDLFEIERRISLMSKKQKSCLTSYNSKHSLSFLREAAWKAGPSAPWYPLIWRLVVPGGSMYFFEWIY